MAISEKQNELDLNKWYLSEESGRDMCGEFDFCVKCDKNLENPCAAAYALYTQETAKKPKAIKEKPVAAKAREKKISKELTAKPAAKTAAKKQPAKKPAKKTK